MSTIDTTCVNAIRVLSADAIQKANSGHPGLPLGAAPIAYELWANHMNHNAKDPKWANRDRFILSAGHGSMLLYSLLHFYGYGLTMDDIKQFRQDGSLTPGHPEYGHTTGVEATTGPLGAGLGMAVGMAMAEAHLAAVFNKPGYPVVDHYTFALCGDGCLMEGISSEAFSLAGTLGLSKLIVLYDSNNISIEGNTDIAFTENVQARMAAFGFQTITVEDGTDLDAIGKAIEEAKADKEHPSFITIKTQIGYGCPAKQGSAAAHGSPLGEENIVAMKENLGWPKPQETFYIPDEVYTHYAELSQKAGAAEADWQKLFADYAAKFPEMKAKWDAFHSDVDAKALLNNEAFWAYEDKPQATRSLSGTMINRLKDIMPQLFGGSADLAPSNKTEMKDEGFFSKADYSGRNVHFGVRELAMGAITNGLALHGGVRPYAGTFFVFSDYMKPMIRLAALMSLPTTYVLTHDSIGVGEDGPTHQPIEHLAAFRAMPQLEVVRPADAYETAEAYRYFFEKKNTLPTAMILTRQGVPTLAETKDKAKDGVRKGAYVLVDTEGTPDVIVMASGSEVQWAVAAAKTLAAEGIKARVVSFPSMEWFEEQDDEYKEEILPAGVKARVSIEAGVAMPWYKYLGAYGKAISIEQFGLQGDGAQNMIDLGITAEHVVEAAKASIAEVNA